MRTARDAIKRILHDPSLRSANFSVGYLDRFIGIIVRSLREFDWTTDLGSLDSASASEFGIPEHRVQFITYRGVVVWQRNSVSLICKRKGDELTAQTKAIEALRLSGGRRKEIAAEVEREDALRAELQILKEQIVPSNTDGRFDSIFSSTPGARAIYEVCAELDAAAAAAGDAEGDDNNVALPVPAAPPACRPRPQALRPTHFVCIRLTNRRLVRSVLAVQDAVCAADPRLRGACIEASALHVTLLTLRLKRPEEERAALSVLRSCADAVSRSLPAEFRLTFEGVSAFGRGRVVYTPPVGDGEQRLRSLHERLRSRFAAEPGVQLVGQERRGGFTPHATIAKLSRPQQRELCASSIDPGSYAAAACRTLGVQCVDGLWLCKIARPETPEPPSAQFSPGFSDFVAAAAAEQEQEQEHTGASAPRLFYPSLGYLHNACPLLDDPLFAELLLRASPSSSTPTSVAELFERRSDGATSALARRALADALQLRRSAPSCPGGSLLGQVVVLRGLPGAGKSTLLRSVAASAGASSVYVCSADKHFTDAAGGYAFDASELGAAHAACAGDFLRALAAAERGGGGGARTVVVVDNTNAQLWQYSLYTRTAEALGWDVRVLEIKCAGRAAAEAYNARCVHGVPMRTSLRMLEQWEADPAAELVAPLGLLPGGSPRTAGAAPSRTEPPMRALSPADCIYAGFFLDKSSRQRLLDALPPLHANVSADHITVCFRPPFETLRRLFHRGAIGTQRSFDVTAHLDEDGVQAVSLQPCEDSSGNTDEASSDGALHVTVSLAEGARAKSAGAFLARALTAADSPLREIVKGELRLDATFGVRTCGTALGADSPGLTVTDPDEFAALFPSCSWAEDGAQPGSEVDAVHVFDFDMSLLTTPNRDAFERVTGAPWPHSRWTAHPMSLRGPMAAEITPGPALCAFRSTSGRLGARTILLTGREEAAEAAVRATLEDWGAVPDECYFKPASVQRGETPSFKLSVVRKLMAEKRHRAVRTFVCYDDDAEVVKRLRALSDSLPQGSKCELRVVDTARLARSEESLLTCPDRSLRSMLRARGALRPESEALAADDALRRVCACWARVLQKTTAAALGGALADPTRLALVFGSHLLGRRSDVDACLFVPAGGGLSHREAVVRLGARLSRDEPHAAVYSGGRNAAVSRLRVRIASRHAPPCDLDIVFATLPRRAFEAAAARRQTPAEAARTAERDTDHESRATLGEIARSNGLGGALSGPERETFALVLEAAIEMLGGQGLRGNEFHLVRTFQLRSALAEYFRAEPRWCGRNEAAAVFCGFVAWCAASFSPERWAVAGDPRRNTTPVMPAAFAALVHGAFVEGAAVCAETTAAAGCAWLLRPAPFPPPLEGPGEAGWHVVRVACEVPTSGERGGGTMGWHLSLFIEARLGPHLRRLLEEEDQGSGKAAIEIRPNGRGRGFASGSAEFAVRARGVPGDRQLHVLKQRVGAALRPLVAELKRFACAATAVSVRIGGAGASGSGGAGRTMALLLGGTGAAGGGSASSSSSSATSTRAVDGAIAQVRAFAAAGAAGGGELLLSPSLNSRERLSVHRAAEQLGLLHESEGAGRGRRIAVRRRRAGTSIRSTGGALTRPKCRRELSDEGRRLLSAAVSSVLL